MQQQFGMCHSPTNKLARIKSPTINQGLPYGLYVTLCMQGNFTWDLSSECIFFKNHYVFSKIISVKQLGSRSNSGPDLGVHCYEMF